MYMGMNKNAGSTLLEVVIYAVVFGMILIGVSNAVLAVYKTRIFVFEQGGANSAARVSLNNMIKDIREASFADDGAYPVDTMQDYQFIFYSDMDNDLKIERIRYFLDGNVLKRGVIKSTGTPPVYDTANEVLQNVSSYIQNKDLNVPIFNYYDKDGKPITNLNKVLDLGSAELTVISDINTNRAPEYYKFSSTATLRNLMNSYAQ